MHHAPSVVIYGPTGSGKTKLGYALSQLFHVTKVIEVAHCTGELRKLHRTGALYLTSDEHFGPRANLKTVHIDEAIKLLPRKENLT